MKAIIQRNQIRHFVREDGTEELQLGIEFIECPDLPTYGITVDITGLATKAEMRDAIVTELLALVDEVQAQMQRDATARQYFDDWGWSDTEFETDTL